VNIDFVQTSATDFVCDAARLPYRDDEVDSIETYHMIEHLPRDKAAQAVHEWFRVLRAGGTLAMECPDFDATVRLYLAGEARRMDDIFGLQTREGDTHYWGYNEKRLRDLLQTVGFLEIQGAPPTSHHCRAQPCIRVEARKRQA
jgi:predicted SAM-dependent methyltransferase